MNYRVIPTKNFTKELKRFLKKYPSLKSEIAEIEKELSAGRNFGTPLGRNAFKIRVAVKSKGKGKSGGMRVITFLELDFLIEELTNIYLLAIYDKSETASISNEELKLLIKQK